MTQQKSQLHKTLWDIANTLRGNMGADEFRDYILGFIFYKYLSEKTLSYANTLLATEGKNYKELPSDESDPYISAIRTEALSSLGYFILPNKLHLDKVEDIISKMLYYGSISNIPDGREDIYKTFVNPPGILQRDKAISDLTIELDDFIETFYEKGAA